MEISGSTYPTLLLRLGSFPGQWSCQLRRKLQDTSSVSSFSERFQCSQFSIAMNTFTLPLDLAD